MNPPANASVQAADQDSAMNPSGVESLSELPPSSPPSPKSLRQRVSAIITTVKETVVDGLKVTAGIALFGVAWLVDVMLDSDDDDDYWSPRAQADGI